MPCCKNRPLRRIINLLCELYEDRRDVFMSGAVFVSYDESNGNARIAPDFFIAFDVPQQGHPSEFAQLLDMGDRQSP